MRGCLDPGRAIQHIVAPPYAEICGLVVAEHLRGRVRERSA